MYKTNIILVSLVLLLLSGCTSKGYQLLQTEDKVTNEKSLPNQKVEYKILPHDRLAINVYKYPELTPTSMNEKGLLVDSNGYVSLPLIHRVKLAGLTQTQASKLLESKYGQYLNDPALNLEVMNKRIYVLGEVKKPGAIPLDREKLTILEALAFAGDLTNSAVRDNIIVVSHNTQQQMTMRKIDMTNFQTLSHSNIVIKPNDIIYVQPNGWKQFKVTADDVTSVLNPFIKVISAYATFKFVTD